MEREKHHQEKYGIGPYHHHYQEGIYNKHLGIHRGDEAKNKQRIKQDRRDQRAIKKQENSNQND